MRVNKKLLGLAVMILAVPLALAGWSSGDELNLTLQSATHGLPLTINTYDFNGQKIDQIKTNKANIHTDDTMSKTDGNGNEQSSVIDIDYGKHRTIHVGASMVASEGLKNYVDVYNHQHVDVNSQVSDKSVPWVNRYYNDFQNFWGDGQKGAVIFVKSQSGQPIGAFYGKKVSIHQAQGGSLFDSPMKDATEFLVDGHRLFLYRCDYTTYPVSVLKQSAKNSNKVMK